MSKNTYPHIHTYIYTYRQTDKDCRRKSISGDVQKGRKIKLNMISTCFSSIRIYLNAGNIKLNGYHISWYYAKKRKIPFHRKNINNETK
jgi:hypothetical protein